MAPNGERAAILAGGLGTRLAPYTTVLPKPLVPVGERPILELILRQLAADGFERIDLCVAHLGQLIRAYLIEGGAEPEGLDIHFNWETEPLGTAGAIRDLEPDEGPILVMNGDILTDIDYGALMQFHREQEAALTIASHTRSITVQLGVLEGEGPVVDGYVEKPTLNYEVSMGVYVYGPEAVAAVPPERFDLPDLVLKLLAEDQRVCKYPFDGAWYDIGTPGDLEDANAAYAEEPDRFDR